jgi:hypothetical protein
MTDLHVQDAAAKTDNMVNPTFLAASMIEERCDRHDIQPVDIVQRDGKAQQRELPGAQHPAVPFD